MGGKDRINKERKKLTDEYYRLKKDRDDYRKIRKKKR